MVVQLYPHQQKAVDEMHNGCILWGGVGTGKSITSLAYFVSKVCKGTYGDYGAMRTPRDVYVITTAKKRDSLDWETEAIKFGIGKEREASISNVQLTVDSWNQIEKYLGVRDAFFIFDEQRLVGSGAWSQTFIKIAKHNEWVLLSATPGDTWIDYIPVFVANGWYKNRTAFKREHVVYNTYSKFPKIDRYISTGKLVRHRNELLVHMPYKSHTVRHGTDIIVDYDEQLFEKVVSKRWHVYENRPLRDVAELFSVMRKVVNSDESRLEVIQQLLQKHSKLIVFYNFDYELEMLRTLTTMKSVGSKNPTLGNTTASIEQLLQSETNTIDAQIAEGKGELWIPNESSSSQTLPMKSNDDSLSGFEQVTPQPTSESLKSLESGNNVMIAEWKDTSTPNTLTKTTPIVQVAEWNGHKHQEIPKTDRWVYLVQYTAGSEGWNCIGTDAVCFYSLTYSYKAYYQAHGRIDRLNTPFVDLYYYTLVSQSLIDKAVLKALKSKKSFNESTLSV